MAEVTALGFEYADRTGNTLDGMTAAREKLATALWQNNKLQTTLNTVIWASGSVVVVLLVVIVILAATRNVTVVASA
jgi:hypothetical protein